jgi:hypothetical protein
MASLLHISESTSQSQGWEGGLAPAQDWMSLNLERGQARLPDPETMYFDLCYFKIVILPRTATAKPTGSSSAFVYLGGALWMERAGPCGRI